MLRGHLLAVALTLSAAVSAAAATLSSAAPPADDDAAALSLPVPASMPDGSQRPWSLTTEGALTSAALRSGGSLQTERLTFDGRYDTTLAPGVRVVAADLLDLDAEQFLTVGHAINTFREAYVSWQPVDDVILDAGRINLRQGVAFGYNPTDFFREGALRTVDSLDPDSLRQNRLGTAMLRAATLWDSGAFTASFAPRIESSTAVGPLNPDFGATNHDTRWLLAVSQRLRSDRTPQLLLFGGDPGSPQLGLNLTYVMGSAVVAFIETSGGRQPSLWSLAGNAPNDASLRARAATGLTYSAPNKLSVTVEYEYSGAALSRAGWNYVRQYALADYGRYRAFATHQQDLVTPHNALLYATWQDVGLRHLDMTAFVRVDLVDHSTLPWVEMRYHWTHLDAAIRWQNFTGGGTSDFGASPEGRTWQAVLDYYL